MPLRIAPTSPLADSPDRRTPPLLASRWSAVLLASAYLALAFLSQAVSPRHVPFVAFWLPGGAVLAALLLAPIRRWPWLMLGTLVADLVFNRFAGLPISAFLGIGTTKAFEAFAGAWLIRRVLDRSPQFDRLADTLRFVVIAGVVVPALGALLGTANVVLIFGEQHLVHTWMLWWAGHAAGNLLLAPLLVLGLLPDFGLRPFARARSTLLPVAAAVVTVAVSWAALEAESRYGIGLKFLVILAAGFTALRFGLRDALRANVVVGLVFAQRAFGPASIIAVETPPQLAHTLALQLFLLILAVATLCLGSITEERKRREAELQHSRTRLTEATRLARLAHWEFDAANQRFTFNDDFYALYGTTAEREGGYLMSADAYARGFLLPEDIHLIETEIRRALAETDPDAYWQVEHRIRRRDGALRHILVRIQVVKDSTGRTTGTRGANQDVTEQREAEESLRRTRERLELAQRAAGVGSWEWDFATGRLDWSPELFAMFGLDPGRDQASFEVWRQAIHPEDRTNAEERIARAIKEHSLLENDYRVVHPDGSTHWIYAAGRTTYNTAGEPIRMAGICLDTTKRMAAEQALRHSEALFRRIFDEAPIGAAIVGLDQSFLRVNAALCQFLGYTAEELMNRKFAEITHPDEVAASVAMVRRLLAGEIASFDLEKRYLRKDGEVVWGRVSVGLVRDQAGAPLHLAPLLQDITERKLAEQALRESEERLRITLETTQIGVWDWDVPSDRWNASPTYYTMLGYPPETGPGDRTVWLERVHPDDRAMVTERIAAVLSGSAHSYQYEARMKHADGPYRWQLVRGDAVAHDPDDRPTRLVGTRMDINARRIAEEELRQNSALLEAQIDATIDGILVVDTQGQKRLQNRRMIELWKIPPEIANDRDDQTQVRYVACLTRYPEQFLTSIAHLYSHPQELLRDELELADGTILDRYSAPVMDRDGRYYGRIWTFRDITERKRAEEALRQSEQKHRLLIQNLHAGVVVHDPETHILFANDQASILLGLTPEQMFGKVAPDPEWCFLRDDGAPLPLAEYPVNQVRASRAPMHNQVFGIRRSGTTSPVWVLVNGFPYLDGEGALHQIVVTFVDITKLKHVEATLRETLREREALLKEVHHRVKNNLQIISSLLRLQAGRIDEPATIQVLQDMQGRIRSMALLHETLYRSGNLAQVDLADYLENVCTQIVRTHQHATGAIELRLELAPVEFEATQAVPCGLLVNELVSNSFKHAFPSGRPGTVCVRLETLPAADAVAGGMIRLSVADDGVGLPPDLEVRNLGSLGLQLASDLVRQLQGRLEFGTGPAGGAAFSIVFEPVGGSPDHPTQPTSSP